MNADASVTDVDALPVLDRPGAMERVGGDAALLEELLTMLLDQIQTALPELTQAIHAGDSHQLERVAHSLKGAAASLGAERFRQRAFELEMIGRSGDVASAGAALERLVDEERALRAAIAGGGN